VFRGGIKGYKLVTQANLGGARQFGVLRVKEKSLVSAEIEKEIIELDLNRWVGTKLLIRE